MSIGAKIQYIRVAPAEEARMNAWAHHVSRLTGTPAVTLPDHPVYLWHLVAGNHRVLARGAGARASLELAQADVAAVVEAREQLVPRMVRLEASRGYGWMLLRDGEPVLTCARWYTMERNRRDSLNNARTGLNLLALGLAFALAVDVAGPLAESADAEVALPLAIGLEQPV
jgi:hypothetical protein